MALADVPVADDSDWRTQASCRGQDTDLWFVAKGAYLTAQPICDRCPVRAECLYEALQIEPDNLQHRSGLWGGLSRTQRHNLPALPASKAAAIAALRELLELFAAHRDSPPSERTDQPMSIAPAPSPQPTAAPDVHAEPLAQITEEPVHPTLPVGRLIAWAADQDDKETRAHAEKARTSLQFLRERHQAASRLQHLSDEEARLEEQLAALREQKAQLLPARKAKRKPAPVVRDYDSRTVRAWADANGVDCPRVGQIPKQVLVAWRTATAAAIPSV